MNFLQIVIFILIALAGLGVVLTRDPTNQAMVASAFGLLLATLFLVLQAPDVALSQLVVGAVALPLINLLALAKVRDYARGKEGAGETGGEAKEATIDAAPEAPVEET